MNKTLSEKVDKIVASIDNLDIRTSIKAVKSIKKLLATTQKETISTHNKQLYQSLEEMRKAAYEDGMMCDGGCCSATDSYITAIKEAQELLGGKE